MAVTFPSFRTPISSSAALPNPPKPKSNTWWTPIFGWSSGPDYITNQISKSPPVKRIFRGCLTEEKAKELRKKMAETTTFHDIMYHSAIASRLATDFSGRNDP
ncbi:hypothetical protein ACS0TY_012472 [Phlomoides rotata]